MAGNAVLTGAEGTITALIPDVVLFSAAPTVLAVTSEG